MKLLIARTLAWTLLLGGWLALGAAGPSHLPLWIGGLVPLVMWLAAMGLAMQFGRDRSVSSSTLRWLLVSSGGLATLGLSVADSAVALLGAAVAWAVLVVAASRAVRLLRTLGPRPAPPVAAATLGALGAWAACADASVALSTWLPSGAGLGLAALLPRQGEAKSCHAGLFDCAWPLAADLPWRDPSSWGLLAARWTMLPMMATLAVMAPWCGGVADLSPVQWIGLHLAAMLLPPLLLQGLAASRTPPAWAPAAVTALMTLGVLLPWAWPGIRGLMALSLCHSMAWGLAWAVAMSSHKAPGHRQQVLGAAVAPALAAAAVGGALAVHGPAALEAVHAALGLVAAAAVPVLAWRTSRRTRHPWRSEP